MNSYPTSWRTLLVGAVFAVILLGAWEMHWRSQGYVGDPDDNKGLWAEQRGKLNKLSSDDVVIIGSSRVLFDLQLDEWEAVTGRRPVQLAAAGSSPFPVLTDIVENSSFNGTLIFGYTPPLVFSPFDPEYRPYKRISNWVDHYHKRTWADRLNYQLYKGPQRAFAFLNVSEEGFVTELDLHKRIENLVGYPEVPRVPGPPNWPAFSSMDFDRNTRMYDIVVDDPAYAARITAFWSALLQPPPDMPPPEVIEQGRQAVIGYTTGMVKQLEARGGRVIFIRCPSIGPFRAAENGGFARENHWDPLIEATGAPGYHFEDYEFMNKYTPPEWSHLSASDAEQFTTDFVRQLQADGHL